jgi:hypothetical protein
LRVSRLPLFLRSLPLSFGTLWHYVFVLPIAILFALPLMVLTLLPLIGSVISVTIFTFIAVLGYRCALAANGKGNEPAVDKLVKSSMFFGVINTLVGVFLALLCFCLVVGLGWIGVTGEFAAPWGDAIPMVPSLAVVTFFIINGLYNCAIAVPMTAAAVEATPNGRSADPLFGIGRGMFSLALIWIIWLVGIYYSGLIQFLIEQLTYLLYVALGNFITLKPIAVPEYNLVWLLISTLFLLWGTCWYYATAVIAWNDEVAARAAARVVTREVSRMSADDLRALREARMQKNQGPTP